MPAEKDVEKNGLSFPLFFHPASFFSASCQRLAFSLSLSFSSGFRNRRIEDFKAPDEITLVRASIESGQAASGEIFPDPASPNEEGFER